MSASNSRDSRLRILAEKIDESLQSDSIERWNELEHTASDLLKDARVDGSDDEANRAWYLKAVAETRSTYLFSFQLMQSGKFYEAWCKLERVEIALSSLRRNQFYSSDRFGVAALARTVDNWQRLFPYAVFLSPEFAIKRKECSICGLAVHPWSACQHEAGIVYRGEECHRVIKVADVLGISLVEDPVQKYSVAFTTNAQGERHDHYDYTVAKFVVDRLRSAISGWTPTWTKAYHPHELFKDVGAEDGCPCGSGRQYRDCCKSLPGVVKPHIHIEFDEPPDTSLPEYGSWRLR